MPISLRAKQVVETRIPCLRVGSEHTTSSAIHRIRYVGPLREWTSFEAEVKHGFDQEQWGMHILTYMPTGEIG